MVGSRDKKNYETIAEEAAIYHGDNKESSSNVVTDSSSLLYSDMMSKTPSGAIQKDKAKKLLVLMSGICMFLLLLYSTGNFESGRNFTLRQKSSDVLVPGTSYESSESNTDILYANFIEKHKNMSLSETEAEELYKEDVFFLSEHETVQSSSKDNQYHVTMNMKGGGVAVMNYVTAVLKIPNSDVTYEGGWFMLGLGLHPPVVKNWNAVMEIYDFDKLLEPGNLQTMSMTIIAGTLSNFWHDYDPPPIPSIPVPDPALCPPRCNRKLNGYSDYLAQAWPQSRDFDIGGLLDLFLTSAYTAGIGGWEKSTCSPYGTLCWDCVLYCCNYLGGWNNFSCD